MNIRLEADAVLVAIGQAPDPSILPEEARVETATLGRRHREPGDDGHGPAGRVRWRRRGHRAALRHRGCGPGPAGGPLPPTQYAMRALPSVAQ
ncbi:MAG: hypothetical protein Q8O40_05405 [Chloroflexota bacterium]|nr:hypothetical protein [Chloroflexota bacterium]